MKTFINRVIRKRKLLALKRRLLAKHKPNKKLALFNLV
jgi:hypothetical protein